jgi:hypothetical protein
VDVMKKTFRKLCAGLKSRKGQSLVEYALTGVNANLP